MTKFETPEYYVGRGAYVRNRYEITAPLAALHEAFGDEITVVSRRTEGPVGVEYRHTIKAPSKRAAIAMFRRLVDMCARREEEAESFLDRITRAVSRTPAEFLHDKS